MKRIHLYSVEKAILKDPRIGEDTLSDHNKILVLLTTGFIMKIILMILVIFNVSFFFGIFFLIIAEVTMTIAEMENNIE